MPTLVTDPEELKKIDELLKTPTREETTLPSGLPSDKQDIYTQPDKSVGPKERLRLQSEAQTGVETTGWGVAGRMLGDLFFMGDTRKVAQKNALSDIIKGSIDGYDDPVQASPVPPYIRQKTTVDLTQNSEVLERMITDSGLDLGTIRNNAIARVDFYKNRGEAMDYATALYDSASTAAEDEMAKRVHVSARASRALPGGGGGNKPGFGYSVIGGGLQNVPYTGQFVIGSMVGGPVGLVLPFLAAYDRRYEENRQSEFLLNTETGGVKMTKEGLSSAEAVAPSMVGAIGETAANTIGGKVTDKAVKWFGGRILKATGADKYIEKLPFVRSLMKSFDNIAKVTQVQEYPSQIAEEYYEELWDAGFGTTKEYRQEGGLGQRLLAANRNFGDNFSEIALSMLLMQGGQMAIAAPKAISEVTKERNTENNAAAILRSLPGVDAAQADAILADKDARGVLDYITSLSPEEAQTAAKRMSARSVQAAEEIKKTTEWMDALGPKGVDSRFVAPTPEAFSPLQNNTSVYVDPNTNIRITRDSATGELEVMNLDTGRTAYVSGGMAEGERMQRATAIANAFDRESQGRDIVNTKKREMLSNLLETKGVGGRYVIVDSEDILSRQEGLSDKAKRAIVAAKENGGIPQAFVDDGAEGAPVTYFVLDNIRMGSGQGAIGKTLRNIVDAATHEPFHRSRYANAETSKIFKDMYDKSTEDLRMSVIRQGIELTNGKGKVSDTLKSLAASAEDTPSDADYKDKELRRYFEEGVAYGIEGSVTTQSTGFQKTMNRLRELFRGDIGNVENLRVLAEQAMGKAKGKVTIENGIPVVSGVNADEQAQEAKQQGLVVEVPTKEEAAPIQETAKPYTQSEAPVQNAPESVQVAPEEAAIAQMEEPTAEPPPVPEETPVSPVQSEPQKPIVQPEAEKVNQGEKPVQKEAESAQEPVEISLEENAQIQPLTESQRSFGEELAKKYGSPVKPIRGAIEPYESIGRFENMLERAADRSTDAKELGRILEQAIGLGQESRIVWSILNNPHTSTEDYAKAKKNKAVRAMTSDKNINSLDDRRAELRTQRGLDVTVKKETRPQAVKRIKTAFEAKSPVSVADIDKYGVKVPDTYGLKDGEYVYMPTEVVNGPLSDVLTDIEKMTDAVRRANEKIQAQIEKSGIDLKAPPLTKSDVQIGETVYDVKGRPWSVSKNKKMVPSFSQKGIQGVQNEIIAGKEYPITTNSKTDWGYTSADITTWRRPQQTTSTAKKTPYDKSILEPVMSGTRDEFMVAQKEWRRQADAGEITTAELGRRMVEFKVKESPKAEPIKKAKVSGLAGILDDFDNSENGIETVRNLADAVEQMEHPPKDATIAVANYRASAKEDFTSLGLRGDVGEYESKLVSDLRSITKQPKEATNAAQEGKQPEDNQRQRKQVNARGVRAETGGRDRSVQSGQGLQEEQVDSKGRTPAQLARLREIAIKTREATAMGEGTLEKTEMAPKYSDVNGKPLTKTAEEVVDGAGGIPAKYKNRVTITKASTGNETRENMIIRFAVDGKEIGMVMDLFGANIASRGNFTFMTIDPDWSIVRKSGNKETVWGREIELYGESILMKDLPELFSFYDSHKAEIAKLEKETGFTVTGEKIPKQQPLTPPVHEEASVSSKAPELMTTEELDAEVERMEDAQPVQPQGVYSRRATMSPEEAGRVAALADLALWKRGDAKTDWGKEISGGMAADTLKKLKDGSARMKDHRNVIQAALANGGKVNAAAVDSYGITLPQGYVREGDLYVFKPTPPTPPSPKQPLTPPVPEPEAQTQQKLKPVPDVSAREGSSPATAELNPDFRQVLSKHIRSLIPRQEQVERSFGRGQWKGYITHATEGNDVLRGFAKERHAGGNTAWVKPALAKAETAADLKAIADKLDAAIAKDAAPVVQEQATTKPSAARIPKGAKVVTTYDDKGTSFSGEFMRDNGDGTVTFRAFGSRLRKGLFRRFGVDENGVQITREMTVPSETVKATEPMADLNRMTPAQREALRLMSAAQDARMEREIAVGESAQADELTRRTMAEERAQAQREEGVRFRILSPDSEEFAMEIEGTQAVDADGKPVTVFHGSPVPVEEIRDGRMFFTSSPDVAQGYTYRRGLWLSESKTPSLIRASLVMRHPLVIDAMGTRNDNIRVPWSEWKPKVFGNLPKGAVSVNDLVDKAEKMGRDGVIIRNVVDTSSVTDRFKSDVYVVFKAEQVLQHAKDSVMQGQTMFRMDQTDTPAFRAWFRDSKVVDADGTPLLMFHGTNRDFNEFRLDEAGGKTGNPNAGLGFFFSPSASEASRYATAWGRTGGNVMPVYLSIKNPYRMSYKEFNDLSMASWNLRMSDPTYDPNAEVKFGDVEGQRRAAQKMAEYDAIAREQTSKRRAELIAQGYDGVVVKVGGIEEFVAFSPNQIKSATANVGTFDPANPDIRFSMAKEAVDARNAILADAEAERKDLEENGFAFDAERFIFDLGDSELDKAFPIIFNEYYGDPRKVNAVVFHRTPDKNADSIIKDGLKAKNISRGVGNRGVGNAVFASAEDDVSTSYGDTVVEIDLAAARQLGDIETALEPSVEREIRLKALADMLGVEDRGQFDTPSWYGETADTLVIMGDISPRAIRVTDKKGNVLHTGDMFGKVADGIRFSMDKGTEERMAKARETFKKFESFMDNDPTNFRRPANVPQTPIVQPQVLDKAQLRQIIDALSDGDAPALTPSRVNYDVMIQEIQSRYNESEIRHLVTQIANDRRDWHVDDETLFKMRIFLTKRENDIASYADQMYAAERNGDSTRINQISEDTEWAEADAKDAAIALEKSGSKRGSALQVLQRGMDKNYNVVYRVRQFRKTTGRSVSTEDFRKIREQAAKDAAEQKKLYKERVAAITEETNKRMEDAISKAKKEFDKQVAEAFRKGASDERVSFEFLLNKQGADRARRKDPTAGFEGIDIGNVAFRVEDGEKTLQGPYPGGLRDLARKVFTEVQAQGLGSVVFSKRMFQQGEAKYGTETVDKYIYDFLTRLGVQDVTPSKKMPAKTPEQTKGRKFKNDDERRIYEVKEAVKRAISEDIQAPGDKVAKRASEILSEDQSDFAYLTTEEIYGVVTGYPVAPKTDTREELEKRYDMIRRHMLALQRVGDMEKGVYPSKMTRGQDAPDVTLRQLSREVRDMMNNFTFPADATDPRLVNAQKALTNRLQYAIEELQKAVDTSTPINEKTARAVEETPEIKELRKTLRDLRDAYEAMPSVEAIREVRELEKARRNANKRYHFWNKRLEDAKAGVFPESFKGTTEAEKDAEVASYKDKAEAARKEYWQIKKNSPQERLATLTEKATKAEERLASLEEALNKTPVENPSKQKEAFVPSTPEEEAVYARLQAAREAIANVRKAILAKWRDENAEAIYKVKEAERFQYLSEKAAKIEQKIKNRDFTKEPKRKPVTSGRIVIAEEKVRQGMRTIEERIQWEANAASGWTGKVKNAYNKSGNVYRAWKASYDLSNVFVQSARLFTAHPLIGGRLIKETFNNAWTDEKMAEFMSAMHADPQYEMAYADGLALDQQFDDYFGTGMGEAFFRGLAQKAKGSTPGSPRAIGGMIAQGVVISQRAFDMYGRAMRFEAYKAIVNDPAHSNLTPIQRKAIANMVNIMGGVGNTKMYNHNFAALLSNLMWSSRLFTAQLQTVTGGGGLLWNAGLGPEGSRANMNLKWYESATPGAYKLYARSIAGNIVLSQMFAAIGMLLGDRQPWEDEETLFWKAFNFLFGRPVIGSKNFDFSGGLTTYVSLSRRLIGGSHIAMSGRAVSDEGFAGRIKVLSNFFRGRLRPDIAFVINVAFGEDVTGEKFGPRAGIEGVVNMVGEGAIPITPLAMSETMGDLFKTHGWTGIAVGLIPSLASDMFGAAKSIAPRDPRYEIERHKSHMGQVNKALKAAQDSGDFTEYERLRDIYLFDVQVDADISSLDQAGKKALKVADDPSYADDVRQQAKKDAEYMFATARDILRGQGK